MIKILEECQPLNEFDKPTKVSNKNYKRTLKEISDVISSVSQKELIPKQCNEIIEDIYYKVIELKNMFSTELENKSIEELKDAIDLAYNYTAFASYVEDFITSHGVSEDSETIFDGMSDEDVIELYDTLRDKLIKHYGPDYDELNSNVYDAFNLMI